MKKVVKILFVFLFIIPIMLPFNVKAETIRQWKEKLEEYESKAKENDSSIGQTEEQIKNTKNRIAQIYADLDNMAYEISKKEDEIVEYTKEIEQKNEEIKELMKAYQITSGDSFYLEYIFGATSIQDFIYRLSITEQISKYNSELIKEMNDNIEANKKANEELKQKRIDLSKTQSNLSVQLNSLGSTKNQLYELSRDIEDEIENAKSVIKMYQDAGCGLDEDFNVCANRLLPPDTKFFRPMTNGVVTSEFGWRKAIYNSSGRLISPAGLHEGIDLSNSGGTSTKLYAVANGVVAKIWYDNPGGGNQVVIHHNINGVKYSSSYAHMSKVLVKEGQIVTRDTVVGMMGATGSATGYHLHIAISTGLRYKDYYSYSDYASRCLNPRTLINFPKGYSWWYDRVTKY